MEFREALELMKEGHKVKRQEWEGYWQLDRDAIKMHCKDGVVLDLRETDDTLFTMSNVCANDWEVATADNSGLLKRRSMKKSGNIEVEVKIDMPGWKADFSELKRDLDEMEAQVDRIRKKASGIY